MAYGGILLLLTELKRSCREWLYGIENEIITAKANKNDNVCARENL